MKMSEKNWNDCLKNENQWDNTREAAKEESNTILGLAHVVVLQSLSEVGECRQKY